jgi:hypothetical protein
VRGLIGETWRLVRSHGRAMLLVAFTFLVPAELAVAYASEDSQTVGLLARLALYLVGYSWVFGALLVTIDSRGRPPLEPYGRTVDRVPSLTLANLVVGVGVAIGLLLLIVPGLLLAARWSAVIALITLEQKGPIEAFETSNGLVRGRTWPVVGALGLVLLACLALAAPGLLIVELADSTWARGLGEVLADLAIFIPSTALTYAIYRRARAT